MTFTYVDPTNTDRDKVRFLLSDTDTVNVANQQLQDAEIAWLLSEWGDVRLAAAEGAETIAGKFMARARSMKRVGDLILQQDYSHTAGLYKELAESIRDNRDRKNPPMVVVDAQALVSTAARDMSTDPTTDFTMGIDDNRRG